MEVISTIAEKFKDYIRENVSENAFDLWFRDIDILRADSGCLYISVKTQIIQESLRRQTYASLIREAAYAALGRETNIDIYCEQTPPEENTYGIAGYGGVNPSTADDPGNASQSGVPVRGAVDMSDRARFMSKYTFDNFIVGKSNEFAHKVCRSIADGDSTRYNLFLYGPSGIGKTHLLFAVANEIMSQRPETNVICVNCEDFMIQFIDAITPARRAGRASDRAPKVHIEAFKEMYRNCDLLLIDDIQFLEGKATTVEEFFYTFKALYESGKQIVLVSDRPPREIDLEERLISRFEECLVVDIQPPDLELRTAIYKSKADEMGIDVDISVLLFLAENITTNIRQIEGTLKKLHAYSFLNHTQITLELARSTLHDILSNKEPLNVKVDKILSNVSKRYSIPVEELKGKKRTTDITFARHVAIYIMRTATDMSFPAIAKVFFRDHTTILSAYESMSSKLKSDRTFENEIANMIRMINNN